MVGMGEHYFSPDPRVESHRRTVKLNSWGCDVELVTDSGVFSPKRIDSGTQRLLDARLAFDQRDDGSTALLDLGCGYGPIAIALALRYPHVPIWAVEVNERARELARENVDRLGIKNVYVRAPEEVPETLSFSAIFSNPPIKTGKAVFRALCDQWLPCLQLGGVAYFVIAKNLGADSLAKWIAEQGWSVERVSSGGGFRIFALGGRDSNG